jgi:hypothetical protein
MARLVAQDLVGAETQKVWPSPDPRVESRINAPCQPRSSAPLTFACRVLASTADDEIAFLHMSGTETLPVPTSVSIDEKRRNFMGTKRAKSDVRRLIKRDLSGARKWLISVNVESFRVRQRIRHSIISMMKLHHEDRGQSQKEF